MCLSHAREASVVHAKRWLEGEVEMDVVYGLEPDEVEDGFILTCQSHPRSESVFVDYDLR